MALPFESFALASIIAAIRASTIDAKRHIAIPDDERKSWGGSNPLGRRRCFCRSMTKLPLFLDPNATNFPQYHIVTLGLTLLAYGLTSLLKSHRKVSPLRTVGLSKTT